MLGVRRSGKRADRLPSVSLDIIITMWYNSIALSIQHKSFQGGITMKKITSLLAALALITVSVPVNALTANAFEAATSAEYSEQMKLLEENAFPPSDARFTSVTDGDFKYDVYEAYAFLTEYTNREAAEVTIPDSVNGVPVVGIKGYPFGFCHEIEKITLPDSVRYFD